MTILSTGVATSFIEFTRASNATVTDSDGKIKWAPHNLLTNSESFDAAAWSKLNTTATANAVAAPNGTTTADAIFETVANTEHTVRQSLSSYDGTRQTTAGVYVRANGRTKGFLRLYNTVSPYDGINVDFDLTAVSQTGTAINGGFYTTSGIQDVGGGWYYVWGSGGGISTSSAYGIQVGTRNDAGASSYAGDITKGVYLWGAHLYRSDLAMQPNTSAYPMYNPTTPKNLLGYTEAFGSWSAANAPVITSNTDVAPNGLQSADTISDTNAAAYSGVETTYPGINGGKYTGSIYIKKTGTPTYPLFQISRYVTTAWCGIIINTQTGTANAVPTGGVYSAPDGFDVVDAGDYWRVWVRVVATTASANNGIGFYPAGSVDGTTLSPTGTGTAVVWGAQLSDSASLDSYSPVYGAAVTSAAYYGPRRDFDSAGVCKGLLVEEQRANLQTASESFGPPDWTKTEATVTANAIGAPTGTLTADLIIPSTVSGAHWVAQDASVTTGLAYTQSIFAKAGGYSWIQITESSQFGSVQYVNVNLTTGALGSASGYSASNVSVVNYGNGWWRISVTDTTTGTGSGRLIIVVLNADTASRLPSFIGDGTSGIYLWGAQLEAGSFATSYIPTGAATATRNADVASVSTQAFPYSGTEGTIVANVMFANYTSGLGRDGGIVGFGSSSPRIILESGSGAGRPFSSQTYDGTDVGGSSGPNFSDVPVNVPNKVAFAFTASAGGQDAITWNGLAPGPDTHANAIDNLGSITTMQIGKRPDSPAYFNGHIRQITYLPRKISDTELQTRTS